METMTVIATDHGPVATEENAHRFIADTPVIVPCSSYYMRRLADGEIKVVSEEKHEKTKKKASE